MTVVTIGSRETIDLATKLREAYGDELTVVLGTKEWEADTEELRLFRQLAESLQDSLRTQAERYVSAAFCLDWDHAGVTKSYPTVAHLLNVKTIYRVYCKHIKLRKKVAKPKQDILNRVTLAIKRVDLRSASLSTIFRAINSRVLPLDIIIAFPKLREMLEDLVAKHLNGEDTELADVFQLTWVTFLRDFPCLLKDREKLVNSLDITEQIQLIVRQVFDGERSLPFWV